MMPLVATSMTRVCVCVTVMPVNETDGKILDARAPTHTVHTHSHIGPIYNMYIHHVHLAAKITSKQPRASPSDRNSWCSKLMAGH